MNEQAALKKLIGVVEDRTVHRPIRAYRLCDR